MPHKRASARVRSEKKREMDLPVSKEDSNVRDEDTPKGFSRLFRFKDMQIKRQQEKKEGKSKETKTEKKDIKIQPGEKLKDFVKRVEYEYQSDMANAYKTSKSVSESKKKNRENRKQKKKSKLQKDKDFYGGRDFDDLKDNVKFGEVANAPPTFSNLPKARGRSNKEILEAIQKESKQSKKDNGKEEKTKEEGDKGYESEEDENMKQLKASHKRKIQNMSAAARLQLDNERERAISAYRAKKAKKA